MFLQQFSFTVKHKAGRLNGNADGLSWTPPSTTVAPQLAAAITEATDESSNNFVIIREAQAKDVYMASVLKGSHHQDSLVSMGRYLFTKECFVGVTKNLWIQSQLFRC